MVSLTLLNLFFFNLFHLQLGNSIFVRSCEIDEPAECKGSKIFEVIIYEASNQYDCVLKGVVTQKAIYQLSMINGECQSQCWLTTGYRNLSAPVNNLGDPSSLGNTMTSHPAKLIRKLDKVIEM